MSLSSLIHPVLDPMMVTASAGLGVSWWLRHAPRPRPAPVELAPEIALPWVEFVWENRVGHDGGALPGTRLVDVRPMDGIKGTEAIIQLIPGKQATSTAVAAQAMVCSAFELPAGSVIIEPTGDRRQSLARLQVVEESPLFDKQHYQRPTLGLSGLARCGTYADGTAAHLRFWEPGSGAMNLLVAGAQGSGKSRFMDWLLTESTQATYVDRHGERRHLMDTYLACGQRGQSFPDWLRCKALRWMGTTTQEIIWATWNMLQMIDARSEYLANVEWVDEKGRTRHGMAHFDPEAAGLPYAQLVVDEAAAAIEAFPQLAEWWLDIAKRGRKNGIRIVLVFQSPSAQQMGGNTDLRAMLAAGGVAVFRVGDKNHGGMAFPNGNCGDPADIPQVDPMGRPFQGAGYVLGPDDRATALMRGLFVDDPFGWAAKAEVWPISEVDAKAGGWLLADMWDRQEVRWAGENPEPAALARMADEEAARVRASLPRAEEAVTASNGGTPRPAGQRRPLRPTILAVVGNEEIPLAEIVAAIPDWSKKAVTDELAALVRNDELIRPSKGRYRRPTVGEALADFTAEDLAAGLEWAAGEMSQNGSAPG